MTLNHKYNSWFSKSFLVLLFIGLSVNSIYAQKRFVYMGEVLPGSIPCSSLRFDGTGQLYPEVSVSRWELGRYLKEGVDINPSIVADFYAKDCIARNRILSYYHIDATSNISFDSIQSIVIKSKVDSINAALKSGNYDNITFIMVGYNNHYQNPGNQENTAPAKLKQLREKINQFSLVNKVKTLIVEVYWDGTASEMENLQAAVNFHFASLNSYWTGLGLRQIVNGLKCNKVQFISHSMGANVIAECVFNQYTKIWQRSEFAKKLNKHQEEIPMPSKSISAALIAPAIAGTTTFIDYLKPTGNKTARFIVGFNTNDSILTKKFETVELVEPDFFISKIGPTSLGCLKSEVDSTAALFNRYHASFTAIDFSYKENHQPEYRHELRYYMAMPQYDQMLKVLFNIK